MLEYKCQRKNKSKLQEEVNEKCRVEYIEKQNRICNKAVKEFIEKNLENFRKELEESHNNNKF